MEMEWLILADAAQVVGNKLYLLGGGWDRLAINSGFPVDQPVALAMSFKIPWHETNQRKAFEVEIVSEDGQSLRKVSGGVEVGRPPGLPPGQEQRAQIAAGAVLHLTRPGTFTIIGRVDGEEQRRVVFNVIPGPNAPRPQTPA